MSLKRKNISRLFITIFVVMLTVFFISKYLIINKFDSYVENLPSHIDLKYDDVEVQVFSGSLKLDNIILTINGQTTDEMIAKIAFETVKIDNLGYLDYAFNDNISIESVKLFQPRITYFHNEIVKNESYTSAINNKLHRTININAFEMTNAEIEVLNVKNDSLIFSTEHLDFKLTSIEANLSQSQEFPFKFKDATLTSENTTYAISKFENIIVSSLNINTKNAEFSDIEIKTKYSKSELSKHLTSERDHFDLNIASIDIPHYKFDFSTGSTTTFESNKITINNPVFHIYRDKLIADDLTRKPLYSKMLRHLDFDLILNEVIINNAEITYEENVKRDKAAGKLEFSELDANIQNISNTESEPERTSAKITTNFMKDTPLKVDWNFDVNNVNDEFIFKADIGLLKAEHLNQFMQPNLNLKLEGELIKTYFTIDGNANYSKIDLKTDYNHFDIVVLKENGEEKNKFLSELINLLIAKDSNDREDRFRYSDTKTVERDKTKSVFNFVWKNTRAGLVSAMTGDGNKED